MAWSTPSSRTTGTMITAAIWNADIVDNLNALRTGDLALGAAWTPTEAHITFAAAAGRYYKLGALVIASFALQWPGTADANQVNVSSLPYAATAGAFPNAKLGGGVIAYTDAALTIHPIMVAGFAIFAIYNTSGTPQTNANLSGKSIIGFVVYETP